MSRLKLWFNKKYPEYKMCHHRWCFQPMTYDYRCHLHQGDK